jgi:hypothetical protein
MTASRALIKALAVTAELTATTLSEAAARVMADDLSAYPEPQVLASLVRCRKELRGRLTIADVIARLDDGRPGAEEAWAMVSKAIGDERVTIVWTAEMRDAFGVAEGLEGDTIAARMAFLERYRTLCQQARDSGQPIEWSASLGHDSASREAILLEAAEKGRLTAQHVAGLLPHRDAPHPRVAALLAQQPARIESKAAA